MYINILDLDWMTRAWRKIKRTSYYSLDMLPGTTRQGPIYRECKLQVCAESCQHALRLMQKVLLSQARRKNNTYVSPNACFSTKAPWVTM